MDNNLVVRNIENLEAVVGDRPQATMMKSIECLDNHCVAILQHSVIGVLVCACSPSLRAFVVGGWSGFARVVSPTVLALDFPNDIAQDTPAALLFLVPGWRETLRVNGRIVASGTILVEEAFLHCGKAIIRSGLWGTAPAPVSACVDVVGDQLIGERHRAFLATSSFLVIGSCDASGAADASPKGDPAGFVQVIDGQTLAIPDRPGNQRTDTMHNLVERPSVVLLAMTPGDGRILEVRGRAHLSTEPAMLRTMAVNGREPKIAVVVTVDYCQLRRCAPIRASMLWEVERHADSRDLPNPAAVWTDHVKQNKAQGSEASEVRATINVSVLEEGIASDYKRNLY